MSLFSELLESFSIINSDIEQIKSKIKTIETDSSSLEVKLATLNKSAESVVNKLEADEKDTSTKYTENNISDGEYHKKLNILLVGDFTTQYFNTFTDLEKDLVEMNEEFSNSNVGSEAIKRYDVSYNLYFIV